MIDKFRSSVAHRESAKNGRSRPQRRRFYLCEFGLVGAGEEVSLPGIDRRAHAILHELFGLIPARGGSDPLVHHRLHEESTQPHRSAIRNGPKPDSRK
jgi:hypothetical protein